MDPQRMISGDSTLVEKIVSYLKSKGIFDEFRHECLADVDTKSSCQNLSQRVDGYAAKFLANETWHPDLNKNELRNKLRRHIDESGMLAVGADHVVEQVINPKIHQLFLPKIIEVVHQYMKEQNELFNKKPETSFSDNTTSENVSDAPDSNKGKTSALDPIADILSFSSLKSKTPSASASNTPSKTDNVLPKYTDVSKTEKKKEEKSTPVSEKNVLESPSENPVTPTVSEGKSQIDKEKIKKEEPESSPEMPKKSVKDESKVEKKKSEDTKPQATEINTNAEENKPSTSVSSKPIGSDKKDAEENKASTPVSAKPSSSVKREVEEGKEGKASASSSSKPSSSSKKDVDRSKLKSKSSSVHKTSSSSSGEAKKPKKESSDKSSDKYVKSKSSKSSKDLPSPSKSVASAKNSSKEEKGGEISKSKSSDSSSSKTSESSVKKPSKSSSSKKDHTSSKHKSHSEKTEKYKASKTSDKKEQNITESSSGEKGNKNMQYSSSYDSSQGSDQDKSSSSSINRDRQKHFSKHAKKESSEKSLNKSSDTSSQKRKVKEADESPTKKLKNETNSTQEKFKEGITLEEAAKISSRSNSFGSTSSVSSSSNTSKDNVVSNSDETSESCGKDKKKKQPKDKEACHNLKKLPPPPPPPPPSSSLSCELTSADVSSVEDTQSSSDHEHSSSNESSDESSSESESESKESALNTLNETLLNNSSSDDINEFYDIFLYSSSSSEFEGFGDSPEKQDHPEKINESDVSVSSVHTSDLSSFDDELSDDDFFINNESQPGKRKRLTLKEAEKLLKSKAFLQSFDKNKSTPVKNKLDDVSSNKNIIQKSSHLSSEDESSPSEPKRSLRRERKLNPRYASSEYTSIFNSRKETFITKQSSPYVKNQAPNSSPKSESKLKKETNLDTDKSVKKNSLTQTKVDAAPQDKAVRSLRARRKSSATVEENKIFSENSKMSSSDELDSFMDKEQLFHENDKSSQISGSEQFKRHFKFKSQNNSNFSVNSYPVKRKLTEAEEASPAKRPCSRASVDSTSSECVPNENKPFNSEKHSSSDEKITKSSDFKGSDLTDTIKKDMFCKQRTNNNGDILGQKDIFSKPSRGKVVNASEKK